MRTTSPAAGIRLGDQVVGLDHEPEPTLVIDALAQKSGMPNGRVWAEAVDTVASPMENMTHVTR